MLYQDLTNVYEKLASTSKRLKKTYQISKLIESAKIDELEMILLLLQGKLFPVYDERKIGVAAMVVLKAIKLSTGFSSIDIENEWKKTGDLGITALNLISKKKQTTLFSEELDVKKVFDNLRRLAIIEGSKSVDQKIQLIAELLTSAKPSEAKYIVRTVLEDLRIGIGSGTLRDAISWAVFPKVVGVFYKCPDCGEWMPKTDKCLSCKQKTEGKFIDMVNTLKEEKILTIDSVEEIKKKENFVVDFILTKDEQSARKIYNFFIEKIQEAYDLTNDFGKVAKIAKEDSLKGLSEIKIEIGKPLNLMLYPKAKDIEDAFRIVGKPAAIEYKYDGFRMEIHRNQDEITLFTRRLENVKNQFPDVVNVIKEHTTSKDFIIDAEIIGFDKKTKRFLPFQNISKRIKRKYGIEEIQEEIPVVINVFDMLYLDGKTLIKAPFKKRRELLTKIIQETPEKLYLAEQLVTEDIDQAEKFYQEALDKGNEGIMLKNLEGIYKPGARVGYGVKVKPVMETLDVAIIAAEWGEGKRSGWLTSFTIAIIDDMGELMELGKVSTGFKEKSEEGTSFEEITELLKPFIISEKGKSVALKPNYVIEINFEEIQKSTNYSSGYALRFPRFVRLRSDRRIDDASDLELVEELYHTQRGK